MILWMYVLVLEGLCLKKRIKINIQYENEKDLLFKILNIRYFEESLDKLFENRKYLGHTIDVRQEATAVSFVIF